MAKKKRVRSPARTATAVAHTIANKKHHIETRLKKDPTNKELLEELKNVKYK